MGSFNTPSKLAVLSCGLFELLSLSSSQQWGTYQGLGTATGTLGWIHQQTPTFSLHDIAPSRFSFFPGIAVHLFQLTSKYLVDWPEFLFSILLLAYMISIQTHGCKYSRQGPQEYISNCYMQTLKSGFSKCCLHLVIQ